MAAEKRSRGANDSQGPGAQHSGRAGTVHAPSFIRLGYLAGAHGLRGALRFRPDNPDFNSITSLSRVFVERGGAVAEYEVRGCSPLGRSTIRLMLGNVSGVDQADALKGAIVMAAREDLPPAGDNEFYYYETLGCEVVLTDGRVIGCIDEVFFNGANDVWVVREGEREILVPVVADVVRTMDFEARRITIEAVPGLLD